MERSRTNLHVCDDPHAQAGRIEVARTQAPQAKIEFVTQLVAREKSLMIYSGNRKMGSPWRDSNALSSLQSANVIMSEWQDHPFPHGVLAKPCYVWQCRKHYFVNNCCQFILFVVFVLHMN